MLFSNNFSFYFLFDQMIFQMLSKIYFYRANNVNSDVSEIQKDF